MPLARFVREHPGELELAAACDLEVGKAEVFCKDFGFARAYSDVEAMLAGERLDACAAIVNENVTPGVVCKLLEADMPCIVEKPLGVCMGDVRRMLEVAGRTQTAHHFKSINAG